MSKDLLRIFKIIYMICLFIYGIVCLVLSIKAFIGFSKLTNQFDLLLDNWRADVITDIQTTTTSCPSGYENLINYYWGGTTSGCDCRGISSYNREKYKVTGTLNVGSCTVNETKAGCDNIYSTSSSNFHNWHNGYKICGKRLAGHDFQNNHMVNGTCNNKNYKICGGKIIDKKFCVPKSENCPITSIVIGNTNPNSTLYNNTRNFYSTNKLFFTTTSDDSPLVQTTISEGLVCKDHRKTNINPGHYDYFLAANRRSTCSETDSRWAQLTSIGELDFFSENGKADLRYKLPNFYLSNSYNYYLYSRSYIFWKSSCFKYVDNIYNNESNYKHVFRSQLALMIINILACIALSIVLQASDIANLMGCDVPCIEGKEEEEHLYIICIKRIINYFFKLMQLPTMIIAVVYSGRVKNMTNDIANTMCSDSITNDVFINLNKEITNTCYKKNVQMLILLGVMVFLDITIELGRCLMTLRKNKKDKKSFNQELQSTHD